MQSKKVPRSLSNITYVLSFVELVGLFCVNTIGFVDTETGSAFGCGHQWPLCHGAIIPRVWGLQTLIEFSHRGLVALITILLFVLTGLAWKAYGRWVEIRSLLLLSIGFVFFEAFLGAMGVLFADPPLVLAFHFGVSLIAFNGILLLCIVIYQIRKFDCLSDRDVNPTPVLRRLPNEKHLRGWIWSMLIFVYIAMYFGAYVSSTGSGALFRGWPFPTESYAVAKSAFVIDIVHRSIALVLTVLSIMLFLKIRKVRSERKDLYIGAFVYLGFVILQSLSGAYLIYSHLSLPAFLLHVSLITGLFATISYLAFQVLPEPRTRLTRRERRALAKQNHTL